MGAAGLFGGRVALQLTAAVPATMALLYLLLILYFRTRGGYKKEVVLSATSQGGEYLDAGDYWKPAESDAIQRKQEEIRRANEEIQRNPGRDKS